MLLLPILKYYIVWHYTTALHEILHLFRNFAWFIVHFCSLPLLTRSLFAPWKRITEKPSTTFNLEAFAGYVIINIVSRIIGFLIRLSVLSAGLISFVALLGGLIVTYVCWVVAPIGIVGSFLFVLTTLFTL